MKVEAVVFEEGDHCPACTVALEYLHDEENGCCSCHINPPCSWCTDTELGCPACGELYWDGES